MLTVYILSEIKVKEHPKVARKQEHLRQLQKRYEELKRRLRDVGFFRRGSLVRRHTRCGRPGCRCQADPPQPHGPYWQWTRKVGGKTQTTRLTEEEASLYQDWADNARELDRIVKEMAEVSLDATEVIIQQKSSS